MASITEKFANLSPKTRQYIMLGGASTVLLGLVFGSVALMDSTPQPQAVAPVSTEESATNIATPGSPIDPKEVWMTQSSDQMRQMDNVIKELKGQMEEASKKQSEENLNKPQESVLPPLPPIQPTQQQDNPQPPSPLPPLPETEEKMQPHESGIASFEVSKAEKKVDTRAETKAGYVPAGSFVRVALLGGLDAPTGGQAQSNPIPILMRTQDNAFLPNRFRFAIKECFLLASSFGDMSSERAFGRLENLSCVKRDGSSVDIAVKGYVVGEDGKAGMRGRLISKQGQVLANALLAGIGAGIGQAFQSGSQTNSISALGTTSTVNAGQQFQNGIGSGVGKALDRLSKYYIDLAEKLFPVIEIDAGRTVEVVFTKGFSLETDSNSIDGTVTEYWRRGRAFTGKPLNDN